MGIFSKNLRKDLEEEVFNDTLIGPQGNEQEEKPQYFFEGFNYSDGPEDEDELPRYELVKSKSVPDSDGFTTDYSMYFDHDKNQYIFMFGDSDIYEPDEDYADHIAETAEEAEEWFDSYEGFTEDDDDDDEDMYDEDHTAEWLERHPDSYYNNERDYGADSDVLEEAAEENALPTPDEIVLSTYSNYRLLEVTEDDEVYYIIMAPDGSVMTEDFYSWTESEGIDFDSLATSDKVARFADYVDSIKQ